MSVKPRTQGVRRTVATVKEADFQYVASMDLDKVRQFVSATQDLPGHAEVTVNDLVVNSKDSGTYLFRGISATYRTREDAPSEQA